MDSHLKQIPGLTTLTARCLTGGNLQDLGGEADGALDTEFLRFGTVDELGADFLEGLDVAARKSNADFVDFRALAEVFLAFLVRHGGWYGGSGHDARPGNVMTGVEVEVTIAA